MNRPPLPRRAPHPPVPAPALPALLALALALALACAPAARAETSWLSVRDVEGAAGVRLEAGGATHDYVLLEDGPAVFRVRGPRRVKVVARYLFARDEADGQTFRLRVLVDGSERLRKSFTARIHPDAGLAGRPGAAVSALRRCTVELGTGLHTLQVSAETAGAGRVAARFYRSSSRRSTVYVPFAPEGYAAVRTLQFESGSRSTYYQFDDAEPLVLSVTGPTTLRVYTRLDFDHRMNGSQAYALEVRCDGEIWKTFHYHTRKLSGAAYLEQPAILPGSRKLMRIPVPRGQHRYEIICLRPARCGVAARVQLPRADIARRAP